MELKTKTITELIKNHFIGKIIEFYEEEKSCNLNLPTEIFYTNEEPYLEEPEKQRLMQGEQIIEYYENNDDGQEYNSTSKHKRIIDTITEIKPYRSLWIIKTANGYSIKLGVEESFKIIMKM
jgi:hypothetical protein